MSTGDPSYPLATCELALPHSGFGLDAPELELSDGDAQLVVIDNGLVGGIERIVPAPLEHQQRGVREGQGDSQRAAEFYAISALPQSSFTAEADGGLSCETPRWRSD